MTMKSTGNGNSNSHRTVGTTGLGAGVTQSEPFDSDFIAFDTEDANSLAAESSRAKKRRRSRRVTGAVLLLLFIASVAIALYFMLGNRTPVNINVRDTRTQAEKTQSAKQSQEDVTSQAIAEVR